VFLLLLLLLLLLARGGRPGVGCSPPAAVRRRGDRRSACRCAFGLARRGVASRDARLQDRKRDEGELAFELTGGTTRCLNLGSYNYLGFADDWMSTCGEHVLDALEVEE